MNKKGFAALLKQKRTTLNLSQSKVAQLCYLSKSSYSHLERGIRFPSLETLIKLSEVLKTDPKEFIFAIISDDTTGEEDTSTGLIKEDTPSDTMYHESFIESFNLLAQHEQKAVVDIIDSIINSNKDNTK